ncbi:YciI family protein [Kordiimonas lipolytica]|uniref:YciI family protein n=1 Tax=Kordiimonas lipolytica TaxID=1662421 RepID=A0ABV8U9F3_9PROT|nr:hypothetical protein [Kordiimonas lipolytica]
MFIVFLKLKGDKSRIPDFMADHKAWIGKGFDAGTFLAVGTLEPGLGGAILAHGVGRTDLEAFLNEDPFVVEGIAAPEIHEVTPARTEERLAFLMPSCD